MVREIGGYGEVFGRNGEGNGLKGEVICGSSMAKVRLYVLTGHFVTGTLRANMTNAA